MEKITLDGKEQDISDITEKERLEERIKEDLEEEANTPPLTPE